MNALSLLLGAALLAAPAIAHSPDRHPEYEPSQQQRGGAATRNLLYGATLSCSGFYGEDKPELAVDGRTDQPQRYWGCENLPVWLQADMGRQEEVSSVRLWLYWLDGRVYQFCIEGSEDGQNWTMLADQRANSVSAGKDGFTFHFAPRKLRYLRCSIYGNSQGAHRGGHIVEFQAFGPQKQEGFEATALSADTRLERFGALPAHGRQDAVCGKAWRGERFNAQIGIHAVGDCKQLRIRAGKLQNEKGAELPVRADFVRYTMAQGQPCADIIGREQRGELASGSNRPVWLSIDVPQNAPVSLYRGELLVQAENAQDCRIPIELRVLPYAIPAPKDWEIYLDIWQHPEAVARYHGVQAWSEEHFALLKPLMKRLADAGQKTITCSIIDEAWGEQTYDWWPSMISWKMDAKGEMHYDYSIFDRWVAFMENEVGIRGDIICYTMLPWSLKIRYEAPDGNYRYLELDPDKPSFQEVWGHFLADFKQHLQGKGWLEKACIGLDERPDRLTRAAVAALKRYAPELRIASAVNQPSANSASVYHISPVLSHTGSISPQELEERRSKGQKTTFYVCCIPGKPNTFSVSPLPEAEWLGNFAAAQHFDGFLRWAYNSWGRNPMESSDFGNWSSGDCFLVYPGNLSSPRWERLRDGLENFEKVAVIRRAAAQGSKDDKEAAAQMDSKLQQIFTWERSQGEQHEEDNAKANAIINDAAQSVLIH